MNLIGNIAASSQLKLTEELIVHCFELSGKIDFSVYLLIKFIFLKIRQKNFFGYGFMAFCCPLTLVAIRCRIIICFALTISAIQEIIKCLVSLPVLTIFAIRITLYQKYLVMKPEDKLQGLRDFPYGIRRLGRLQASITYKNEFWFFWSFPYSWINCKPFTVRNHILTSLQYLLSLHREKTRILLFHSAANDNSIAEFPGNKQS